MLSWIIRTIKGALIGGLIGLFILAFWYPLMVLGLLLGEIEEGGPRDVFLEVPGIIMGFALLVGAVVIGRIVPNDS